MNTSNLGNEPTSVGLGGDGDEFDAIQDVEREFGVNLNYDDAPDWITAGDVFQSLLAALPESEKGSSDNWDRFAVALCDVTGTDAATITHDSPLLASTNIWQKLIFWGLFIGIVITAILLTN